MQTHFSLAQLADPDNAVSEQILRTCVHCGFCLATCPTYTVLGDELDSPRGRIYQIKSMLEGGGPAPASVAKHLDRCLSCLSCMTTCPSGVHYMHLVDHGRAVVEKTYRRPLQDRAIRALLAAVLPRPRLFRLALMGAMAARPVARLLPRRLRAMLALAPRRLPPPSPVDRPQVFAAEGPRKRRVALLSGCAQTVLDPAINEATIRLLTRHGVEVVVAPGAGCCGSLTHHMGREEAALASARANIEAWGRVLEEGGLDAIVVNTSGCGTTVKDYGHMFRADPAWAGRAARISALAKDVTELMDEIGLNPPARPGGQAVAYHSACSMQHGQRIAAPPRRLLAAAGFELREVPDGHLCCGSAGTYNLLQPEIADELRARKVRAVESTGAAIVAAGNIGCITQIGLGTALPVVHTVELLDWATGGPKPAALKLAPAAA
ncbi:glycolate oxidase subunit GlcF [Inquilinus sp. Marseille-Q2685]|uniref:glycolate oxidase subunit GlcF n=1 Tax=Inquilinus sp. Marseille-Q2685 TaxID=2866581 RepID=UPI001CE3C1D7|nr:glycolate oxidase subunit GlcF [Inquilinus sp. Marseille-Q2685]